MSTSVSSSAVPTTAFPAATILGYPRIGRRRELKKAVEAYWAGRSTGAELEAAADAVRAQIEGTLIAAGLGEDYAIADTFSLYDQVLDTAVALGAIPERFGVPEGDLDLDGYFTLARGNAEQSPLEMTKWFDSNYHYLVPEINAATSFAVRSRRIIDQFRASAARGVKVRPYLVGPVTFLALSKAADQGFSPLSKLEELLPFYAQLLTELAGAGAEWVQLDEPALVADGAYPATELAHAVQTAYHHLTEAQQRPAILLSTPYGGLGELSLPVLSSGVEAVHLDLFKGGLPADLNQAAVARSGGTLVAGVVDGHNVWRNDLAASAEKLQALAAAGLAVSVATSTSTFHVPHDVAEESNLPGELKSWLSFADQKAAEVVALARDLHEPGSARVAFGDASNAIASRQNAAGVKVPEVQQRLAGLKAEDFHRTDYTTRQQAQQQALDLPLLPTTTIGSFPQTSEIRSIRARRVKGELDVPTYQRHMEEQIAQVIKFQEELGFDVLVHGEPERNDMVQYFAQHLEGFASTENGWVQSYGSRCTRPAILFGDVHRPEPITVQYSTYAQSLTPKPVKGMLTGPVTILAWSFPRDDQPLADTANQVALALRDEIGDLQAAGISVIQVDEPALRELLPLRTADQAQYLDWSVTAFKLATSGAAERTQIHTHLCYSEFGEVISAIDALDADVTSIEAARSKMEVLTDLQRSGFSRGIGPGVYDIHSPRVPSVAEIEELLRAAVAQVPVGALWVNPDCGLKTRAWPETEASLRNLVQAAHSVRESVQAQQRLLDDQSSLV